MATRTMKEITRSNASRNYLEHIDRAARTKRALELEASLYDWRGCQDRADDKIHDAQALAQEIEEAKRFCERIGGTEGKVLRRHYIDGASYADIADEEAYSERQIGRYAMLGRVALFDMLSPQWQNTVLVA